MNRLSIKARVTIWYTAFVAILSLGMFCVLYFYSGYITQKTTQKMLISTAERAVSLIRYENHTLTAPEIIEDIQDIEEVDFLVYSLDETLLYGQNPYIIMAEMPFQSGVIQKIQIDEKKLYIYDIQASDFWLRSVDSYGSAQITNYSMLKIGLISIPLMLILSGLGGYFITKKAFAPMEQITNTVNQIMTANDLDKRLTEHYQNADEMGQLAQTFDNMLGRLQKSFCMEQEFTSNASHELRTPVASILSQCDYLRTLTDGEALHCTDNIRNTAHRMSELISSLLMLTRAETNRIHLCPEPLNFSEMTELIAEEFSIQAEEKKICLITDIQPNILIQADQTLLMQMLINLFSNALKYTENGGKITVTVASEQKNVIFSIKDTGIGIPSTHLEQIWQRFYREENARKNGISGYGLGLPIARWIVEVHGGEIHVQSQEHIGTVFHVKLPMAEL